MLATQGTKDRFPHLGRSAQSGSHQFLGQGAKPFLGHGPKPVQQARLFLGWLVAGKDLGFDFGNCFGVEADGDDAEDGRKATVVGNKVHSFCSDFCFVRASAWGWGSSRQNSYRHSSRQLNQTMFRKVMEINCFRAMRVFGEREVLAGFRVMLSQLIQQITLQLSIKQLHQYFLVLARLGAYGGYAHA